MHRLCQCTGSKSAAEKKRSMSAKPRVLGAKRGANASPAPTRAAAPPSTTPSGPAATAGERARVCLRIRPALTEEEGQDNTALQCDLSLIHI